MSIDEDRAVEAENAAEQRIDKEGKEEMSVEEDRALDSIAEKRENEGGEGIGEGEEANRGQSLDESLSIRVKSEEQLSRDMRRASKPRVQKMKTKVLG